MSWTTVSCYLICVNISNCSHTMYWTWYQWGRNEHHVIPDSKVQGANMGPTWVLKDPDGPHVGPHEPCYHGSIIWVNALLWLVWYDTHCVHSCCMHLHDKSELTSCLDHVCCVYIVAKIISSFWFMLTHVIIYFLPWTKLLVDLIELLSMLVLSWIFLCRKSKYTS